MANVSERKTTILLKQLDEGEHFDLDISGESFRRGFWMCGEQR